VSCRTFRRHYPNGFQFNNAFGKYDTTLGNPRIAQLSLQFRF